MYLQSTTSKLYNEKALKKERRSDKLGTFNDWSSQLIKIEVWKLDFIICNKFNALFLHIQKDY